MIKKFDEFNAKFKFLFNLDTDMEVSNALGIENTSYATMKRHDNIPYDKVIEYCKERCVDLNWIMNIKKNC